MNCYRAHETKNPGRACRVCKGFNDCPMLKKEAWEEVVDAYRDHFLDRPEPRFVCLHCIYMMTGGPTINMLALVPANVDVWWGYDQGPSKLKGGAPDFEPENPLLQCTFGGCKKVVSILEVEGDEFRTLPKGNLLCLKHLSPRLDAPLTVADLSDHRHNNATFWAYELSLHEAINANQ